MAVAQVSLRSAVKAPVARAARNTKRTTRAAKVVAKAGMERVEVAKKVAPVALSVATVMTAAEARAAEVVAAVPQEVFATADIPTPVLYFAFLTSSLTFAVGTYVALTKIKLI